MALAATALLAPAASASLLDAPVLDPPTLAPTVLVTAASPAAAIGGRLHDTATLVAAPDATGAIEFSVYGPDDPGCTGTPLATSTRVLDGGASYDSDDFTPTHAGTYRWVASYGGDAGNAASAGSCGDPDETVTVARAPTMLAATASAAVVVGGQVFARAQLDGGADPHGGLAFALYGPDDPTCAGAPLASSTRPVAGAGRYDSELAVPPHAGQYRFVATYGGDQDNAPAASGCADGGAAVTVTRATTTIAMAAPARATSGEAIGAHATLAGDRAPAGAIAFALYGPDDQRCSGAPVSRSTAAVDGAGDYESGAVAPAKPGVYRWMALYGGDRDNAPTVTRCGAARTVVAEVDRTTATLDLAAPAEAALTLTAHAPGTDWGIAGRESAVASVSVDGRYSQDVVLFEGAQPFDYRVSLGRLGAGSHSIHVRFNRARSPAGAQGVVVDRLEPRVVAGTEALVARYAPILYGRDEPDIPGRYENNRTDVPLLAYHTTVPEGGGTTIHYFVVWSNEDGGTPIDALMPRWGRTTDIEWVDRVHLDAGGRRVLEEYQDSRHKVHRFGGRHEGAHPLLQTVGANNGVGAVHSPARSSGYRFLIDASTALPADLPRDAVMGTHPWTYALSAAEAAREHKFESRPSPTTRAVSDPRNYLFVRLAKDTTTPGGKGWVGTSIEVRLAGRSRWYRSDHGVVDWSIAHDGPITTSVELPPGTREGDVRAIRAVADVVGRVTPGWRVRLTGRASAFFLDRDYRPVRFSSGRGLNKTLSAGHRMRWIWER